MKSYGSIYAGKLKYYHKKPLPILEKGWTQETEFPFRKGNCLIFRAPFTIPGVYVGLWKKGSRLEFEDEDVINDRLSSIMSAVTIDQGAKDIGEWDV